MQEAALRDESGIRIRTGRDPQMVMEGEGEVTAPPAETTSAPVETTAPTTTETTDLFDNTEVQSFDRNYVTKLREEAANYRTQAKTYKDAFDGYDEGSANVLLNVINTLKTDTTAGVQQLKEIISILSPEEAEALATAVEEELETEKELTVEEQVAKALEDRDKTAKQEAAVRDVIKQVSDAGFAEGTPEHIEVLWLANYQTNGDIPAAVKVLQDKRQAIIDDYIATKQASNDSFIKPADGSAPVAGDSAGSAKTLKDARARAEERIAAAARGGDA